MGPDVAIGTLVLLVLLLIAAGVGGLVLLGKLTRSVVVPVIIGCVAAVGIVFVLAVLIGLTASSVSYREASVSVGKGVAYSSAPQSPPTSTDEKEDAELFGDQFVPVKATTEPLPAEIAEKESAAEPAPKNDDAIGGRADLPAWIDTPTSTDDGIYQRVVRGGKHQLQRDSYRDVDEKSIRAVEEFVSDSVVPGSGPVLSVPIEFIHDRVVEQEFTLTTREDFGIGADEEMHQVYRLIRIDENDRAALWRFAREGVVRSRLIYTGLAAGVIVALLATLFAYLRIDAATGGQQKGRLRLAAATMILGLSAAGAAVVSYVPLV